MINHLTLLCFLFLSAPHTIAAGGLEEETASSCIAMDVQSSALLRARRPLFEAVLRLESSGICIVERALRGPDIALTPDACLCIWEGASYEVRFGIRAAVLPLTTWCGYSGP